MRIIRVTAFRNKLERWPLHMLLIILFFLLHGYNENFGLVPVPDLLLYGLTVTVIALLLYWLAGQVYRDRSKAGLLITLLLCSYLFYGVPQDSLQRSAALRSIARDHVLIPLLCTLLFITAIGLKRWQRLPSRLTLFLNLLLLIYVMADMVLIGIKPFSRVSPEFNQTVAAKPGCDTCNKPDIYLLLLDEYAGSRSLQKKFGFSNHHFIQSLRSRGFFVADASSSNYGYTPLSIASLFNMDYLNWKGGENINAKHYTIASNQITLSPALAELRRQGYELQNLSIFDIGKTPAAFDQGFMSLKLRLITDKTMWERVRKSLFWQIDRKDGWGRKLGWDAAGRIGKGNAEMIRRTMELAMDARSKKPQFVYTHLLMPHEPWLFDSIGTPGNAGYTSYLQYTNREVVKLVDVIMKGEKGRAVVLVMSDHGFRDKGGMQDANEFNNNFNAVYLPTRNYVYFYDSISNVNQFRVLFNSLFASKYEVLKDEVKF